MRVILTPCPPLLTTSCSLPGWKLWRPLCPGPPQGRPLHPVLLHPAPEPGAGLRGEERGSVGQRGDQRHLQPGRVHAERTDANTAVAAGWVSTVDVRSTHARLALCKQFKWMNTIQPQVHFNSTVETSSHICICSKGGSK